MRPYLAVIKDSFREAMASRVLWVLLVVLTVVLAALSPTALRERFATTLQGFDILDWRALLQGLRAQHSTVAESPKQRVWRALPDKLRSQIIGSPISGEDRVAPQLRATTLEALNGLLARRDLYAATAWPAADLGPEARDLARREIQSLTGDELARLNRLLIEAAFPLEITASLDSRVHLGYFGWTLETPLPFPRSQVQAILKTALATFMNFFVGTLGVFVGILVTSPIIPNTFDAGAIDLLLSKPVNRSFLFLAKFVGGCAFITFNAAYLVTGLWLIAGVRFGLWNSGLLLSIPIFLFLFAIYYAVSAYTGVRWRNAIVSVVVTMVFWVGCFLVGAAKNVVEQVFLVPARIVRLVPAGDALLAVDGRGQVSEWHGIDNEWREVFQTDEREDRAPFGIPQPLVGPIYDASRDRVVALRSGWSRFGAFAGGTLCTAERSSGWKRVNGPPGPAGASHLLVHPAGDLLVVARDGVHRLQGSAGPRAGPVNLFGFKIPVPGASAFQPVGPDDARSLFGRNPGVAIDESNGDLVVWHRGKLAVLARDAGGRYQRKVEVDNAADCYSALVAINSTIVVVGYDDGRVRVFDRARLQVTAEWRLEGENLPAEIVAAPGGRWFMIRYHHGRVWLVDAKTLTRSRPRFAGQGDLSALAFSGPDRVWLVDRGRRATEYTLDPVGRERQMQPRSDVLDRVYRYGIRPLYTVFPKPGELDNVVTYLLTKQETLSAEPTGDLRTTRVRLNVWEPVWSSLAFLVVMLGLTCFYVSRADF